MVAAAGFLPVIRTENIAGKYYFGSRTTDNLAQNSCSAILQTRDGSLWIATADGLVRYCRVGVTFGKREEMLAAAEARLQRVKRLVR